MIPVVAGNEFSGSVEAVKVAFLLVLIRVAKLVVVRRLRAADKDDDFVLWHGNLPREWIELWQWHRTAGMTGLSGRSRC